MAKVLIIDDQASIRSLLRLVLEKEGHEIIEASDGRDGLAAYHRLPTDLVITDIRMPMPPSRPPSCWVPGIFCRNRSA